MLHASQKLRLADARRSRCQCRCAPSTPSSSSTVAVVEQPQAKAEPAAEVKIQTTISALDALVPAPPAPGKAQVSTGQASTSSTSTQASAGPSFSWLNENQSKSGSNKGKQVSFDKIMGFEGLAPEVINARCAMLGFVGAIANEFSSGESIFAQLVGGGVGPFLLILLGVTAASFAPALRQVPMEEVFNQPTGRNAKPKTLGPFTPGAEIINGRAAMFGLAIIILVEGASGTGFFL